MLLYTVLGLTFVTTAFDAWPNSKTLITVLLIKLRDPGQVSALNRVQKRAAKFANNMNESGWGNFDTAKVDIPNMRPFQGIYHFCT
jgi:hypothetical protein